MQSIHYVFEYMMAYFSGYFSDEYFCKYISANTFEPNTLEIIFQRILCRWIQILFASIVEKASGYLNDYRSLLVRVFLSE